MFYQMENDQTRPVPVVDEHGHCMGLVAQADLAWVRRERDVAELVREVSRDTGRESRRSVHLRRRAAGSEPLLGRSGGKSFESQQHDRTQGRCLRCCCVTRWASVEAAHPGAIAGVLNDAPRVNAAARLSAVRTLGAESTVRSDMSGCFARDLRRVDPNPNLYCCARHRNVIDSRAQRTRLPSHRNSAGDVSDGRTRSAPPTD